MTVSPEAVTPSWDHRLPDRWRREVDDLQAEGWEYTTTHRSGALSLTVHYPAGASTIRLRVTFHNLYPYFPPTVVDIDGALVGSRHRQPATGSLCLIHDQDWHCDITVARLLATQLPKILASNRDQPRSEVPRGLELPAPESVLLSVPGGPQPVIINETQTPPPHVSQGALIGRLSRRGPFLGALLVEQILAADHTLTTDIPRREVEMFPLAVAGRWIRSEFHPGESAEALWRRVSRKLAPLVVDSDEGATRLTNLSHVELIGVLVPDEVRYRETGETWVWLLRTRGTPTDPDRGRWTTTLHPTQYYSRELLTERTPLARALADKAVVIIGLGSIGLPVAQDLAMTGVGRLTVVDMDTVDPATGTRQATGEGLTSAGMPKVVLAQSLLEAAAPYAEIGGFAGSIETGWSRHRTAGARRVTALVRREIAAADLTIDATANPAVTRFLAAYRHHLRKPHLIVSGTAGGWGGLTALLTDQTGCWACVEHARADGLLPVPPADDDATFVPIRCASPTFRGAHHAMQQIAMHAASVAANHLASTPIAGSYWVASLKDDQGNATPISWTTSDLPVHPSCPLHTSRD